MADIHVPGLGQVPKGGVIAGAAVLAVILGYAYWRHSQSSAAAAAAAAAAPSSSTSSAGTDPNAIDPSTGLTYADEEAAASGDTSYDPYDYGGTLDNSGDTIVPTQTYTTNAQWAQAAESYIVDTVGGDAETVGNALGKYITGGQVTTDQQGVIDQAIAFAGYPPVNGPTGYPPSINVNESSPTSGGGGVTAGNSAAWVTGLAAGPVAYDNITVHWRAAKGASGYKVQVTDHQGKPVTSATVSGTSYTARGLAQKTEYTFRVSSTPTGPNQKPALTRATTK